MCIHAKSMENLRMYALNISGCTTVQIYMLHLHVGRFMDFFSVFTTIRTTDIQMSRIITKMN